MPQDTDFELSADRLKKVPGLFVKFNQLYDFLQKMHAPGSGTGQFVRRREQAGQAGYSVNVSVLPIGVRIEYSAAASKSQGDNVRIDQKIVFRGSDDSDVRELADSCILSAKDGGIVLFSDSHPLMIGAAHSDVSRILPLLIRYYGESLLSCCRSYSGQNGIPDLRAGIIDGIPGVRRRLALSSIASFDDVHGVPYDSQKLDGVVQSVLKEGLQEIRGKPHAGMYIVGKKLLIDCGDSSLLSGLAGIVSADDAATSAAVHLVYEKAKDSMFVYEHDDAIIRLVNDVFPESGKVLLYPVTDGIVRRIFDFYVFHPQDGRQAVFYDDMNLLSLDQDGLEIVFLGSVADDGIMKLMPEYVKKEDEIGQRRREIDCLK